MRYALSLLIVGLFSSQIIATEILRMPLNETSGTTATATVGANGTYVRDASNTTVAGPGGSYTLGQDLVAASLDAVTITANSFASGTAFSYSIWFDPDTASPCNLICRVASNVGGIRMTAANTLQINNATNFALQASGAGSLDAAGWHHVLVARAVTTNLTRVFVDNIESTSGAQAVAATINPDRIGLRNGGYTDGKFAGLKVFNSDESANVAALYAEGTTSGTKLPIIMQQLSRRKLLQPLYAIMP